jgi:hypothetical protein
MSMILDGSNGVTFNDASLQGAAASPYVLKNRIINGAMVIDQRNAGASVTITDTGANTYTLDRWFAYGQVASKFSVQQNAGSVTPSTGFTNYLGVTSLSAYTVGAGEVFVIGQQVEGLNVSDLAWGTASAKTVTLSFQVYSSLTGTFGGALQNSAQNRSYPFSYTVSSANTWTTVSVTIAGDTTGTWLTTNGVGIRIFFSLGVGATNSGTAGSWAGATYWSATGAVSVVGTSSATFYITGVQLEQNTSATPFERRLYNQELANCQRYYWQWSAASNSASYLSVGWVYIGGAVLTVAQMPVPMRIGPALTTSGTASHYRFIGASGVSYTCNAVPVIDQSNPITPNLIFFAASNPALGQAVLCGANTTTAAYLGFTAEL